MLCGFCDLYSLGNTVRKINTVYRGVRGKKKGQAMFPRCWKIDFYCKVLSTATLKHGIQKPMGAIC